MHIGINGMCFQRQQAGMCTYVLNVVSELARNSNPGHRFTVFLPSYARDVFPRAAHISYVFIPTGHLLVRIALEQLVVPVLALWRGCRLLHSMGNVAPLLFPRRHLLTVHDIYFIHFPRRFKFFKRTYLRMLVPLSVWRSREIIAVSAWTRGDILHHYHKAADRVVVVHEGHKHIPPQHESAFTDVAARLGIDRPFYLYVGTIEPGKNLARLIRAFERLEPTRQLVIVGKWWIGARELLRLIDERGLKGRVLMTGFVNDSDLAALYRTAKAFVLASLHEGFGLPLIEAMSYELPVCCSNTSSLPEVAGDAAIYFDPAEESQIADALQRVQDMTLRAELIRRGRERCALFTWAACARRTMAVYDAIEQGVPVQAAISAFTDHPVPLPGDSGDRETGS